MFDYSKQIEAFRENKVRLGVSLKQKLYDHRKANRERLISRLKNFILNVKISFGSFHPQGSMAVDTITQSKFVYQEYDIDDGLVLDREDLIDEIGNELTCEQVRNCVLNALKDKRFVKQPKLVSNAVRVFYKEEDEERHHIDIPVYRKFENEVGEVVRELASENGWIESDPTQVNRWFLDRVAELNKEVAKGTQFRQLIQLLKRFCRSRNDWDLPNGMKLTMLVAECQPDFDERMDRAFRKLLERIEIRLDNDKTIRNLAHPDKPFLTRSVEDWNVNELENKISQALEKLQTLDEDENFNESSARSVWDWIFRSDGFFRDYDDRQKRLAEKVSLINSKKAQTDLNGVIVACGGVPNTDHRFYGEEY